jgi:hypothetical protein
MASPLRSAEFRRFPRKRCIFGNRLGNRLKNLKYLHGALSAAPRVPAGTFLQQESRATAAEPVYHGAMPRPRNNDPATDVPEFAVDRETMTRFFAPPIVKSTFHDLVGRGLIVPVKGLRGYYRLNASLERLGLRAVAELPGKDGREREMRLACLALWLAAPDVALKPSILLEDDDLTPEEKSHAVVLALHFLRGMREAGLDEPGAAAAGQVEAGLREKRKAFVEGAIDAFCLKDRPGFSAKEPA